MEINRFKPSVETVLLWLIVVLHVYPLISISYFQTLDGPAHLHNSILIKYMLADPNFIGWSFFDPNYFPEPNWFSHIFLALLSTIMAPEQAEKAIQILSVVLIVPAFQFLIKTLKFKSVFVFYIVPFMYMFPLFMGFYNFCIGVALALFAFAQLIRTYKQPGKGPYITLFVLVLLNYFSHVISFLFLLSLSALYLSVKIFYSTHKERKTEIPISTLKNIGLIYLPSVIMLLVFLVLKSGSGDIFFKSKIGLLNWIWQCRPVAAVDLGFELKYTSLLGIFIIGSTIAISVIHIISKTRLKQGSLLFLSASAVYLLSYLIFPDSMASGGFISIRLLLFFYITLILFIAANPLHELWSYSGAFLSVMISFVLLSYHFRKADAIADQGREFITSSEMLESNSILLPLNYSENWLHSNVSNYLGTKRSVVVLDNYEAGKKPFPLRWKSSVNPYVILGNFAGRQPLCADVKSFERITEHQIDYVSLWKYNDDLSDSCSVGIQNWLYSDFSMLYESENCFLRIYERKNRKGLNNQQ